MCDRILLEIIKTFLLQCCNEDCQLFTGFMIFKLPEEELLCLPLSVGRSVRLSVEKISKWRFGDCVSGSEAVI